MSTKHRIRKYLRGLVLGETDLPQACDVSLEYPQKEISVLLHGLGVPHDVTRLHSVACAAPFTFCIGFERTEDPQLVQGKRVSLRFQENQGQRKLLGEIALRLSTTLPIEDRSVCLFEALRCENYCISKYRLHAHNVVNKYHNVVNKYKEWTNTKNNDVRVSALDSRCNAVTFICPRPVVLVCLVDGDRGNVFPMNLLGSVGGGYFAFALSSKRQAAPHVSRLGRLTVSSVPLSRALVVRQLGRNHYRNSISWDQLPFSMREPSDLSILAPDFAIRVQELQVVYIQPLGSHTFFLARVVGEQTYSIEPEFHMIHGFYAAYRRAHSRASLVEL